MEPVRTVVTEYGPGEWVACPHPDRMCRHRSPWAACWCFRGYGQVWQSWMDDHAAWRLLGRRLGHALLHRMEALTVRRLARTCGPGRHCYCMGGDPRPTKDLPPLACCCKCGDQRPIGFGIRRPPPPLANGGAMRVTPIELSENFPSFCETSLEGSGHGSQS